MCLQPRGETPVGGDAFKDQQGQPNVGDDLSGGVQRRGEKPAAGRTGPATQVGYGRQVGRHGARLHGRPEAQAKRHCNRRLLEDHGPSFWNARIASSRCRASATRSPVMFQASVRAFHWLGRPSRNRTSTTPPVSS